jgi:putative MATE family efflux protein
MEIKLSDHFTYPRLLRFVLPSILTLFFTTIYSIVDGIFVSNFVGKTAFAAVNFVMPILMFLASVGVMMGAGGSALVAKLLGEQNKVKANQVFSMIVYTMFIFGIIVSIAISFFMENIVCFLGANGELLTQATHYGRIAVLGGTAFIFQHIFYCFFIVAERPKLSFIVTVVAGVTNILLDLVFIVILKWGISGAALATLIGQMVGGTIPLVFFLLPNKTPLRLVKPCFDGSALLTTSTNGISELVSNIAMSVVSMLYNYQLIKFAGDTGVAAYGAIMYTSYIFSTIYMGYSFGRAPIVSYHYGASNTEELKNLFRKDLVIVIFAGFLLTATSEILAYPLAYIFGSYDLDLFEMIRHGIYIYSFAYLLMGVNYAGSSFFTALNNGLVSGLISFFRTFLFEILAVLALPIAFGVDGIWASTVVAEVASFIFTAACLVRYRKKYGYY